MPNLIVPQLCSFVPGRHSYDNIVIAQKVFHSMIIKKGKRGFVVIKVDLEKAYDRLRWEFLEDTKEVGLSPHFIRLIMSCVTSASMEILFNGARTDLFIPTRGVRQGDPLSPYLFVLRMERLAHCIKDVVARKKWRSITLSKNGPPLTHLFFAEDLLLFREASVDQMRNIHACLDMFCYASGQKVNVDKSRMLVYRNVNHNVAKELSNISGFGLTHDMVNTLESRALSFAGRITLAKSIVAPLLTYTMQTTLLPKYVCLKLEKLNRDFIWGMRENGSSCHTIAWDQFCLPKEDGGLGFRDLHDFNRALLMKLGWGLIKNREALWVQVVPHKYKCGN